jgi:hypothetical protein
MLTSLWSFLFIEVRLTRVLTGLLIGYTAILVGFLLILLAGTLFFIPASPETQLFQKLSGAFLISIVLTSVLFWGLNGPMFAIGIFLASIWMIFTKRLSVLVLLCCLGIAGVGLYVFNVQSAGNQIIGSAARELIDSSGRIVLESWVEMIATLSLNAFPLFVMMIYVYFDPKYRK